MNTTRWKQLHQESPKADTTIESWYNESRDALLFVRDNAGTTTGVFSTAEDVVENNTDFALADVCYGYYTMLFEGEVKSAHDDFLDDCWERSAYFTGTEHQFVCHENAGECEDAFHSAQVVLGNEEES